MSSKEPRPFPGQHESEEVELVLRKHISVIRRQLVLMMLVVLLASLPTFFWPLEPWPLWFWLVGSLLSAAYFFYHWIGWYYSVYIVTNERIIEVRQKGLFNRRVSEFGLDKVQNVNYHIKGLEAMLLRFGDITVQTYVGDLVMDSIHKPVKMHEQIVAVVRRFNAEFDQSHNKPSRQMSSEPTDDDAEMVQ